jgi:hypothetical protein
MNDIIYLAISITGGLIILIQLPFVIRSTISTIGEWKTDIKNWVKGRPYRIGHYKRRIDVYQEDTGNTTFDTGWVSIKEWEDSSISIPAIKVAEFEMIKGKVREVREDEQRIY